MKGIKKILNLARPYWGRIAVAGVCSLVVAGFNGSLAWLAKPAVDKALVGRNAGILQLIALAIFAVFLLKGVFSFFQSYLMRSVGAKIVRDIRDDLYRHVTALPMSFFGKDSTGAVISRIINDAGAVQGLLAYTIKDLFVETCTIIVLISVAMSMRWDLTLIAVIVLPLALYAVSRLGKRLKKVGMRAQEKISGITEMIAESYSGIKIIKSFQRGADEVARFRNKNQDYYRELMRSTRIVEATSIIMEFVGGLGIAFVFLYGGSLVISKAITAGDFFSFLTAIFMIYTPARRLVTVHNTLQQAKAPLERIDRLLEEEKESGGEIQLSGINEGIVFDNVSFGYENTKEDALENINVRVRKGEITALVGKSGAGKTTFVDLLSRFYSPSGGAIRIDGVNISEVTLQSLRQLIGIVSQDIILFNDTVRANIAYGRKGAAEQEIVSAAKAAFAHDFILELPLGYDTVIGEGGIRLSGGQKQRLSIARAVLKNPPILVLDEATSSLDTASEMMVQKALETLMEGRTTFVIAHRLSTVRSADRIIVFDKGQIVESGTHDELLTANGLYKKLYDLQFAEGSYTTHGRDDSKADI
ncbi:MAG: ABC transporter permease [Nitrospirae bacterium CG22_combo_CG10-13_8_21_14_all_44_11]|nr:MAG: ABC transporter permease [Nitrospirae bacterium CG22_combo_CG10-13_8_21_14_all_44_11]